MTLRTTLRAATRQAHDRVDQLGGAFDLTSPSDYRAFLRAHAAVLPGVEAVLDSASPEDLPPAWAQRRRTAALAADLAALGLTPPSQAAIPLAFPDRATRLGALYVLEGSRLGGAVLRRRLAASQPKAPDAYLAHGAGQPFWRSFLDWLDGQVVSEAQTEAAIDGARQVFRAFEMAFKIEAAPAR